MTTKSDTFFTWAWNQKSGPLTGYVFLIILAFLADRLSKRWAALYLAEHGSTTLHPLLTVRETYNRGIALGLFQGIGPWVGWLTIGIVVGLTIYLVKSPAEARLLRLGLSLVIGGASGNLIDRITLGQVLDFIETPLRPGVFNVADTLIYLGMLMILVSSYWSGKSVSKSHEPSGED
jgi:signal peptidase II